jgi:hypothetical protein
LESKEAHEYWNNLQYDKNMRKRVAAHLVDEEVVAESIVQLSKKRLKSKLDIVSH